MPCYGQNYLNPWLAFLTSPINRKNGLFFMNLLFQVLSYKPSILDNHTQKLIKAVSLISSQIVYAILCHHPKDDSLNNILEINVGLQQVNDYFQDQVEDSQKGKLEVFTVLCNGILNYLNQFNETSGVKPEHVNEISERILWLLEEPLRNENSLFVNSLKEVQFNEEIFGILQQLLYYCPQIFENICSQEAKMHRLFKAAIFQFCKSIDERTVNNTYYVSLCLLTILSNNKSFNLMLNRKKDFNINLKSFPIIDGTLADLLISCCAQAIINNKFQHTLCHPFNLMSILKNISPFVKNLSRISCQKLNQLVILFTDMDFLTQTQYTPFCIVKLLEMYNYILSFNFNENVTLVFEIYNRQEIFGRIPKINFHENTLRAYYKQLKERYESQKNNTNSQNPNPIPQQQHQQQDQLQKQGQQLQELSQQLEQQKNESNAQQNPKSKEQIQQQDDMPSSSSLSSKKRPKRVQKKKIGLDVPEGEKKGLQKKSATSPKNSKKGSKKQIEDEGEGEGKDKQPSQQSVDEGDESEQEHEEQKSDQKQEKSENVKNQKEVEIEVVIKNPEDLFVERWKNFNWRQIYSNTPIANISLVIKNTNELINTKLNKNRYDITIEQFANEKAFLTNLKSLMQTNVQYLQDQFQNYEEILQLSYQCCWMQILTKSKFFPQFDPTKVLFFRIDIPPPSLNMNDQSINVELQSNNTLTDIKQI